MRRAPAPQSARAVQSWLEGEPGFRELVRQVDGLLAIQRSLRHACPDLPLEVASLTNGTLTVRVPGGAWASRLRQIEPRLVATLIDAGLPVQAMKIRARRDMRAAPCAPAPKRPPPPGAVSALDALRRQLGPSALQQALDTLVERHSGPRR